MKKLLLIPLLFINMLCGIDFKGKLLNMCNKLPIRELPSFIKDENKLKEVIEEYVTFITNVVNNNVEQWRDKSGDFEITISKIVKEVIEVIVDRIRKINDQYVSTKEERYKQEKSSYKIFWKYIISFVDEKLVRIAKTDRDVDIFCAFSSALWIAYYCFIDDYNDCEDIASKVYSYIVEIYKDNWNEFIMHRPFIIGSLDLCMNAEPFLLIEQTEKTRHIKLSLLNQIYAFLDEFKSAKLGKTDKNKKEKITYGVVGNPPREVMSLKDELELVEKNTLRKISTQTEEPDVFTDVATQTQVNFSEVFVQTEASDASTSIEFNTPVDAETQTEFGKVQTECASTQVEYFSAQSDQPRSNFNKRLKMVAGSSMVGAIAGCYIASEPTRVKKITKFIKKNPKKFMTAFGAIIFGSAAIFAL